MAVFCKFEGDRCVASMLADEAPDATWHEAPEGSVVGVDFVLVDGECVDMTEEEIAARDAEVEAEMAAVSNRGKRAGMLASTDWQVIRALEVDGEVPADLAAYRQALRDITEHTEWPHLDELDWPTL
jgi:hypothetical protein